MMILWLIAQGSGSAPSTNAASDFVTPLITGGAVVLGALISGVVSSVTIYFTNRHQRILGVCPQLEQKVGIEIWLR